VHRQIGSRRLLVMVGITAVVVLAAGGWLATRSPLLDVDRITVTGSTRTPPRDVARAAGLWPGKAMFDVDEAAAARGVGRLPWVDRADVRRTWPGTVVVRVVERVPASVVTAGERPAMLVDGSGAVLGSAPAAALAGEARRLPVIAGPAESLVPGRRVPPELGEALQVAVKVPPALLPRIESIASGPSGVEVRLRPSGVVRFGRASQVEEKLESLLALLSRVDGSNLAVVDVRVPRSPVLTRLGPVDKVSTEGTA
jgi:cell division protein FtsQ